ncbi:TIR domain-containing protein [Amycolatopsis sp. CA-128772]|uniref:TIR domain-containing protein n=1 Tax=Amycolatopsis sp. CA-128772 TaxID=2073159 RepID=UPI001304E882|nr:TIR domain-containing protein [Amycolatopsis sp. CA-128772]
MSLERRVFVIHGRDKRARREFYIFLRAIGLEPIEWSQALAEVADGSPVIGAALDKAIGPDRAIIVLLTPDDVAYLKPEHADDDADSDRQPTGQARPNVLFEAGMAFGRYPEHTVVVEFGKVRPFTDLEGRFRIRLDNSADKRLLLARRLESVGCEVDLSGPDWLNDGDLTPPTTDHVPRPQLGKAAPSPRDEAGIEISSSPGKWNIEFVNITVNPRKRSPLTVRGDVVNLDHDAELTLGLKATLYDGEGKSIGSASGGVQDLTGGERRGFELTAWDITEKFTRVHVHVEYGIPA